MKRWLIPGVMFILILSLGLVFGPGILAEQAFDTKLSPLASGQFNLLSRQDRRAIMDREADHLETLEQQGWDYLITGLTERETRYELKIGETWVTGCRLSGQGAQTSALSTSFNHVLPGGKGRRKTRAVALSIPSLAKKEAVTLEPTLIALGANGVEALVTIRLDADGVHVEEASFMLQDPQDALHAFEVSPFSLDRSEQALSKTDWSYEWALVVPDYLQSMFAGDEPFTFLRIKARLGVDLTQEKPGYYLEGSVIALNKPRADLRVSYYPGDRFSFSLENYLLPLLPSVCINIQKVELVFDIQEQRLVMFGQANLIDTKSLNCALPDEDLLPEFLVNGILNKARDQFSLPESLPVTTGFMLDFDDGFAVGKLSVQKHGLFHAGYFPNEKMGELRMQIPTTYNSSEGTWDVLERLWKEGSDSLAFPETDPFQLYPLEQPAEKQ